MKTIKRKYNTYDFSELNESAKERARQWYLDDDMRSSDWENEIEQDLMTMFPNSDLHIQFSLNSCQETASIFTENLFRRILLKLKIFMETWMYLKILNRLSFRKSFEGNSI